MRIADSMQFEQVTDNLSKNRSEMSNLQNKAATQKNVTKPSDDPVAAARVLGVRIEKQGQGQYLKNLNHASSFLDYTDQSLEELTNLLVRAKELALSQANDASANDRSRKVVGEELGQMYKQAVLIGNRKIGDRHIFGGYKTTQAPFSFNGKYNGDNGEMLINIDKDSYLAMNIPGSKVFLGESLSRDKVSHSTSEQAKTIEELQAQQRAERQEKQQQLNQQNAQVRNPASQSGRINAQGAEGGENKTKQETPVQFTNSNGKNVFKTIKRLEIALRANDKWSIQNAIEETEQAMEQVILARAQVGARVMTLKNATESLEKGRLDAAASISHLEDANIYDVVSDINKTENTLKATLASSGKLVQHSLLDFLR